MPGGSRYLKQSALQGCPAPQPGESIMRVVSLRGCNLFELEDSAGERTICMLPAKFRKSLWIKTGNFVIVDEADREKALKDGNKVTGTIVKVLYEEHIRILKKTAAWPQAFQDRSRPPSQSPSQAEDAKTSATRDVERSVDEEDEDDGLPPLEANMNRHMPGGEIDSDSTSESEDED